MDEFDEDDIKTIHQVITAWRGLSAIGSIAAVVREMFWFIILMIAVYLAASGHFELLRDYMPRIGS